MLLMYTRNKKTIRNPDFTIWCTSKLWSDFDVRQMFKSPNVAGRVFYENSVFPDYTYTYKSQTRRDEQMEPFTFPVAKEQLQITVTVLTNTFWR